MMRFGGFGNFFSNPDERSGAASGDRNVDSGPEYARKSFSLMASVPEEVLQRLSSKHGFPETHVAQIKELARYVAPEDCGGEQAALKDLEAGSEKYNDILAFSASDFILQRLLSYITQRAITKNKYGPTYSDMYDWIQEKKSGSGSFSLQELRDAIVSRMESAKLTKEQLSKLEERTGKRPDNPDWAPTLRQKLTSEYVLRKIGSPDDVDKSQRSVFEVLVTRESYNFMREALTSIVPKMQSAIEENQDIPEVKRNYLAQYVLPRIIPRELSGTAEDERKQITNARNMLWALSTHGIVDLRIDERVGSGPRLEISLTPEFAQRLSLQAMAYIAESGDNPRGNRAVPIYMSGMRKESSDWREIQNLWSSLRNRTGVRHKIPETSDALRKLMQVGESAADALPADADSLLELSAQNILSADYISRLRVQISSLESTLTELRGKKDDSNDAKSALAAVRSSLNNRKLLLDALSNYGDRIKRGVDLQKMQPSITEILGRVDPKGKLKPADRRILESRGADIRKYLKAIEIDEEEFAKKQKGGKRNEEQRHIATLILQLYSDSNVRLDGNESARSIRDIFTDTIGAIDSALSSERARHKREVTRRKGDRRPEFIVRLEQTPEVSEKMEVLSEAYKEKVGYFVKEVAAARDARKQGALSPKERPGRTLDKQRIVRELKLLLGAFERIIGESKGAAPEQIVARRDALDYLTQIVDNAMVFDVDQTDQEKQEAIEAIISLARDNTR